MKKIIEKVRKELFLNIDKKHKKSSHNFFKEKIKVLGVKTPITRSISKKYFKKIRGLNKEEIFKHSEEFLKSGYNEESTIGFDWAFGVSDRYEKKDFNIFEVWLKKYVNNWSKCDDFCTHAFGNLLLQFPDIYSLTKKWTKSKNIWVRRASAVIMIYPTRKNDGWLEKNFEIADKLLLDHEDLVQKAYGWMLKEASKKYQKDVFAFVIKNKNKMPRTALRYAIEKMPTELKRQAMKK